MNSFESSANVATSAERTYLREVFAWMFLALALTTGVAAYINGTADVASYVDDHPASVWILFAVQLGLVFGLSFLINRISATVATLLFALYAGVTGITFGFIFAVYTTGSIVGAFAGAAGLFAGMAVWGFVTDRDLSSWGSVLFGALIGIIVASIAFAFVGGSTFNLIIGWAGVIVFSGLTAYDMQKLKQWSRGGFGGEEQQRKATIFGALMLYLDFINLFLSLLRIFGSGRS